MPVMRMPASTSTDKNRKPQRQDGLPQAGAPIVWNRESHVTAVAQLVEIGADYGAHLVRAPFQFGEVFPESLIDPRHEMP